MSRTKEQNAGSFTATLGASKYGPSDEISVSLAGGQHCGILAYATAANGTEVGTMVAGDAQQVSPFSGCTTTAGSLTHTSAYGSPTEASFSYTAPECDVGTVTLNIVVLSGARDDSASSQTFYIVSKDITVDPDATFDCTEEVTPGTDDDDGSAATLGVSAAALIAGIVSAAAFA
jgi:hypothetical protein